jgi:hypothetical protein
MGNSVEALAHFESPTGEIHVHVIDSRKGTS